MKRNETVLVYTVTGVLLVILTVAVVFGGQPAKAGTEKETAAIAQLPGVTPALIPGTKARPDPAGDPQAGGAGNEGPGPDTTGPKDTETTPPAPTPIDTNPPDKVALVSSVVLPDQALENLYGTSRRMGDFRVVPAWSGASLRDLVERWCGSADRLADAEVMNETLDPRKALAKGREVIVPWVDAEALLAAAETRKVAAAKVEASKGRLYTLASGDSLWKVASQRVAKNKIPAWLVRFKQLNPEIEDMNALVAGQKVRLPH